MYKTDMAEIRKDRLKKIQDDGIPGALEWSDENVPAVRPYIEKCNEELEQVIREGKTAQFHVVLERIERAWEKLFYLFAKGVCDEQSMKDLDLKLFSFLSVDDARSVKNSPFGPFILYPREPVDPPKGKRWLTATEAQMVRDTPAVRTMMVELGAWIVRREKSRITPEMRAASLKRCKEIRANGGGLKLKRKRGGWEFWE